jgi:hypothetical protein
MAGADFSRVMRILGLILAMHAFIAGMALLIAGLAVLGSPSDADTEALRKEIEEERKKGWLNYFFFSTGYAASTQLQGWSMVIAHWPERPKGRKLIYVGAAFVAVAAVIGFSFGLFD